MDTTTDPDNDFAGPEEPTRPIPVRTLEEVSGRWRLAQLAAQPAQEPDEILLAARSAPTRDITLRGARERETVRIPREVLAETYRAVNGVGQ